LELRAGLDPGVRVALGAGGLLVLLGAWQLAATGLGGEGFLLPTPAATAQALNELASGGELWTDLAASLRRIAIGYLISMLIGVVLGLAIGSMASVEAWWEPQIGFLRYIPASALTPLFLLWLGIDETPKVALVAVGTVFFNILMVADVARAVPLPLINAGYTLGAGRLTVLRRIILPHSLPGIIDVARINLAAAWLMLVVAELLAAQEGLAFRIIRAQRFRQVDRMFALLLVFGFIGLVSDLALRRLRNVAAPWAVSSPSSGRRR
jgi:NitT/TauT family transport system permease protein